MPDAVERETLWIFWPFVAIWRLLTWILKVTGRIICALVGLVFTMVGVSVSLSIVGAPVGIPLASLGILLMIRALF